MNRRQFVGGLAAAAWAAPGMPLINGGRLRTHIEELSVFGRPQGGTFTDGVSRVAYSDADVAGRAYVRKNYRWDVILAKYERMFARLRQSQPVRR